MEVGDLARLWKGGKKGCLSPLMQAKAWGLSEAGVPQRDIAAKLEKLGGGHPTQSAVCKLLERISDDPEWYPGKRPGASYGPAPVLRGAKRKQVAASAMLLKRRGVEPTYALVVAQCPEAVVNPETGEAVDKHAVYKVLKEDCRDDGAQEPWVKRTEKTPCDDPRAPPRGVHPGGRSRGRRALGGEHGMESRRLTMCPCV